MLLFSLKVDICSSTDFTYHLLDFTVIRFARLIRAIEMTTTIFFLMFVMRLLK